MPSTWAPTVSSRVTTTSLRPVIPTRTFSSGSVNPGSVEGRRGGSGSGRAGRLPRRPFDGRAPRPPDVDAAEQEYPDDVDEMPIPGRELEADVMARRKLADPGPRQTDEQEDDADDDVGAVKSGGHEEGRAIDRVLEAERRVDVFVRLGEDEQNAKGDPEREEILEFLAVALTQLIMGDVDRKTRGQQHKCVHQGQRKRIDHLGALRRPDAAGEVEPAV